jgi:hypothetical protein
MTGRITLEQEPGRTSMPAQVPLWLYADRSRQTPPSLTDLTIDRLFPDGISHGGFGEVTTRVDGCAAQSWSERDGTFDPVKGRLLRVSICPNAHAPLVIEVTTTLRVPRRFGTLGGASGALVLADPWYPLVLSEGPGENVPRRGTHSITVRWNDGSVAVTPDGAFRSGVARTSGTNISHVPVSLFDSAHVHEEIFAGVRITFVSGRAVGPSDPPPTDDGLELRDPWDVEATASALRTTRRCIEVLRRLGFVSFRREGANASERDRKMASHLVIAEVPERERLAVALPGFVALSDHAFRFVPIERVQRFHELALARRIFTALLVERIEEIEPLGDRAWIADLDGSVLVDLMLSLESLHRDRPQDLIGIAGFHPAVDQLLYAPKVAFRSAYFHDIAEADPDRDGADRAYNDRPFGQLVLEKLRDRLGPALAPAIEAHLMRGEPFRKAVAAAAPQRDLTRFYATWLGPTPRLAYRIARTTSRREGNVYRHRVDVERLGATWVQEPVVVELVDGDGKRERGVWDASGPKGVVEWTSGAQLTDATLDPDSRLSEDPAFSPDHPRYDNEIVHGWRPPIFNSLAFAFSVSENRPDVTVDFLLKRRYDIRQSIGVSAATSARGISGSLRYTRGIGPKKDLNSTLGGVTFSTYGLRSENGFGGSPVPVTEGALGLTVGWDTRVDHINPRHGWGAAVALYGGAAREDSEKHPDGTETAGTVHPSASIGVRGEAVHALHPRHILAGAVGGGITVCPALPQQLQALSGRTLLRGYTADELLGCSTTYAIGEYRLVAINDVYLNAAHAAWFKGLEIVPFAAGGLLSSRTNAVLERFYGEVGGGLRALVDWGGVQPGLFAIDFGLPLSRRSNTFVDAEGLVRHRPPFGLYVAFEQAL